MLSHVAGLAQASLNWAYAFGQMVARGRQDSSKVAAALWCARQPAAQVRPAGPAQYFSPSSSLSYSSCNRSKTRALTSNMAPYESRLTTLLGSGMWASGQGNCAVGVQGMVKTCGSKQRAMHTVALSCSQPVAHQLEMH